MEPLSLRGACRLYLIKDVDSVRTPDDLAGRESIPSAIPSNAEIDLMNAGKIGDVYFGNNILSLRGRELYDLWYEISFSLDEKQSAGNPYLVFHGVDTIAEYFLNGVKIGASDNMLVEHAFDIATTAKIGENRLFVHIFSPVRAASKEEYYAYMVAFPLNFASVRLRKAPHMFGWDIMPRLLSGGIWRGAEILFRKDIGIENCYFATLRADTRRATLWFQYSLRCPPELYGKATLRLSAKCGDSEIDYAEKVNFCVSTARIDVADAKLWWVRDYGEPNLYEARVSLISENGVVLDEKQYRFGLRTVEIERSDLAGKENGGRFRVLLNGIPVFCKGTNWVPADALHARDEERIPAILDKVRDLNCNIVRCWGGNVYEDDRFFEFCADHGIFVWQDLAMACQMVPTDEKFQKQMREEVKKLCLRVRNSPALLLYCGDNESDWGLMVNEMDPANNLITRKTVPETLFRYDPFRPYLPSSPYVSPSAWETRDENLLPENHLWGPRDCFKANYYTGSKAHFISEIGYHGCPNVSSMKKFLSPDKLWPWQDNDEWIAHCTAPDGKGDFFSYRLKLMSDQIGEFFGIEAQNLQTFAFASQVSQAEAKKFFIEWARLSKWDKSGIIWWNIQDGWPQFSDAVCDYYGQKKLAYYYIKRVQKPVVLMMREPQNWHLEAVVANDGSKDAKGEYEVIDADTGETVLAGEFFSPANENTAVGRVRVSTGAHKLFLLKLHVGGETVVNHYLHGKPPFDLEKYRSYLRQIAALDRSFDADSVAK